MTRWVPLVALGCVVLVEDAAASPALTRKLMPANRHLPYGLEETDRRFAEIGSGAFHDLRVHQGAYRDRSVEASLAEASLRDRSELAGDRGWMWIKVLNKRVDPACNDDELVIDLGRMETQEECLNAAKEHSQHGNAAIWQRGIDGKCHLCNLRRRAKALHLDYIDSPHHDSFVQVEGLYSLYENQGNTFMKTPGRWLTDCRNLESDTKYITITYGSKTDYFKPINDGADFCSMLQSNDQHLWSPNGEDGSWTEPTYNTTADNDVCGGSIEGWPATQDAKDTRLVLPSWCTNFTGQGDPEGGYGSESGEASWFQPFSMGYFREYEKCGTYPHAMYPCECGTSAVCRKGEQCHSADSECKVPEGEAAAAGGEAGGAAGGEEGGGNVTVVEVTPAPTPTPVKIAPQPGAETGPSPPTGDDNVQAGARQAAGCVLPPMLIALMSYNSW